MFVFIILCNGLYSSKNKLNRLFHLKAITIFQKLFSIYTLTAFIKYGYYKKTYMYLGTLIVYRLNQLHPWLRIHFLRSNHLHHVSFIKIICNVHSVSNLKHRILIIFKKKTRINMSNLLKYYCQFYKLPIEVIQYYVI